MPKRQPRSGKWIVKAPPVGGSVMLGAGAINLLSLGLPLVMLQIFDRVIPFQALETLSVLVIGLLIALALDYVLKCCRIVVMAHAAERFELELNDRAAAVVLNAEAADYANHKAVDRFEEISAVAQLRDHYGGQGRLLVIDLPFVAVFVGLIWFVGGWLVAVPITCFLLLAGLSFILRRFQAELFSSRQAIDGRRYSFLTEFLERMVTIKANTMEAPMLRRYELLQQQSVAASRSLILLSSVSQSFSAVINQAAVAAMGLLGGFLVIRGNIGVAELAACTLLNGRALQPLMKLTGIWVQAESVAAAMERMQQVLSLPQRASTPARSIHGDIAADRATLHLKSRSKALFSDLTFKVERGRCLAVTGADGAGKSSFLRLLLAEQHLSAGALFIDGNSPTSLSRMRGRGGIAYVDATPVIFQGTILHNIALSEDVEAVQSALEVARVLGMNDAINRLPHGFETVIGPQARDAHSLGFFQQIALARALAHRPKIMLFNEANIAMDRAADTAALAALKALRGKTTLVLVSRRPSYIALADYQVHISGELSTFQKLSHGAPKAPAFGFPGVSGRVEGTRRVAGPRPETTTAPAAQSSSSGPSARIAKARAASRLAQKMRGLAVQEQKNGQAMAPKSAKMATERQSDRAAANVAQEVVPE